MKRPTTPRVATPVDILLSAEERYAILTMLDQAGGRTLGEHRALTEIHTKVCGAWDWKLARRIKDPPNDEPIRVELDVDDQVALGHAADSAAPRMINLAMRFVLGVLERIEKPAPDSTAP